MRFIRYIISKDNKKLLDKTVKLLKDNEIKYIMVKCVSDGTNNYKIFIKMTMDKLSEIKNIIEELNIKNYTTFGICKYVIMD